MYQKIYRQWVFKLKYIYLISLQKNQQASFAIDFQIFYLSQYWFIIIQRYSCVIVSISVKLTRQEWWGLISGSSRCVCCDSCIVQVVSLLSGEVTVHQSPGVPWKDFVPESIIYCLHLNQQREKSDPSFLSSPYCPSTLSVDGKLKKKQQKLTILTFDK